MIPEEDIFMRSSFPKSGKWNLPLIRRQQIDTSNISLIACSDTKLNDCRDNLHKGVHFFVKDEKMSVNYTHPDKNLEKFSQYAFLLSPDFSVYKKMAMWRQLQSVAQSRWCGAYWQSRGLTVIPTISWSGAQSFEFCFDGVEKHAVVAVSTLGCRRSRHSFMYGYNAMMEKLMPETIICYGTPFAEMEGDIIPVKYQYPTERRG